MLGDISCISYSKNPRVNKDMMMIKNVTADDSNDSWMYL